MSPDKVKILIIGGGEQGKSLIDLFSGDENIEIKGMVDANQNAPGIKFAREKGIPTFKEYNSFLEDKEIDRIINATDSRKVQEDLAKIVRSDVEVLGKHSTRLMLDFASERLKAQEELKKAKKELELKRWGMEKTNEGIKTLYKELEKKTEELKALDKLKSEFISTVSHELRTPLTIIREAVAQVLEGLLGETTKEQRDFLSVGLEDIDRLGRIINNLLDISKIEGGKMDVKREKINLTEIIKNAHAAFLPMAKNKGIELSVIYYQDEITIYAEKDKIIQVFNNLIGNALKFTEKGCITIGAVDRKKEIECSVSDTGRGIKEEDIPKLFSKFQQFGRMAGAGEKGTGLGLAISKGIIELYKGKMHVESKVGRGTRFIFTIPKYTPRQLYKEEIKRNLNDLEDRETPFATAVMSVKNLEKLEKKLGAEKLSDILDGFEYMGTKSLNYIQSFVIRDGNTILFVFPATSSENASQIIKRLKKTFSDFLIGKGVMEKIDFDFAIALNKDVLN